MPNYQPKTADEPVAAPRRLLRCSVPMPGPESRDRKGRSPSLTVRLREGPPRSDGQTSGVNWDHKAQAPPRSVIEMKQACRQTSGFDRTTGAPERFPRNRGGGGSDAANPRPSAAPNRLRRGTCDRWTAHREPEGTPKENPAAPTTSSRGHRLGPFPARRSP